MRLSPYLLSTTSMLSMKVARNLSWTTSIKREREEGEKTHSYTENIQENTFPYKRQRLEEGKSTIRSHSFLPFPFLLTPFIIHYLLAIVKAFYDNERLKPLLFGAQQTTALDVITLPIYLILLFFHYPFLCLISLFMVWSPICMVSFRDAIGKCYSLIELKKGI